MSLQRRKYLDQQTPEYGFCAVGLDISLHHHLAGMVSEEKSGVILTLVPLINEVLFFFGFFQDFFFDSLLFEDEMHRYRFFGILTAWCSLSFLDLEGLVLHLFWKFLGHYYFTYFYLNIKCGFTGIGGRSALLKKLSAINRVIPI